MEELTNLESAFLNVYTKLQSIVGWSAEEYEKVLNDLEFLGDKLDIDY